jgi:hypothetical protein
MATYSVQLPFTGYCVVEVEADSAEDAIEAAFEKADASNPEEVEFHKAIVTGNVFRGVLNKASAECLEEDEEEGEEEDEEVVDPANE